MSKILEFNNIKELENFLNTSKKEGEDSHIVQIKNQTKIKINSIPYKLNEKSTIGNIFFTSKKNGEEIEITLDAGFAYVSKKEIEIKKKKQKTPKR